MIRPARPRLIPSLENLEGRVVLSHMVSAKLNLSDGSGASAILSALHGGAGSEFVTLIRREVPNVNGVLLQFVTGKRKELDIKGFAVKTPQFLSTYTGPHLDEFDPTAAGAVILKGGALELGAIMRGPIDRPEPVTYVWGISRGGGSLGPAGFGPSGVSYDAYVSVTHSASGTTASVTDLRTGVTQALAPSSVTINGPTIRVFLNNVSAQLPSTGLPLNKYRMAFWTRGGPDGAAGIGGTIPTTGSILIGSLATKHGR
jgi:hypothetical protein